MRRVLIVSPHFAPVNTADMQRVRLMLPWLREYGWEPTVLAVSPESVEGAVMEPLLEKTYPADIRVVRVRGLSPKLTRPFGIGSLWLRCGQALRKAGDQLLAHGKFDLIFFSTTVFGSFTLGPRWLTKFKVPYVLDYHDPWVNDYYQTTRTQPPGGKLRYGFSQWQARRQEPEVVEKASAIISVSQSYGPTLCARYPRLKPSIIHYIPFGAEPRDIELAKTNPPSKSLIPEDEGLTNLVYTGRVVQGMRDPLKLLFQAFYLYKKSCPDEAKKIKFHFIGTDYAPPPLGQNWVVPVAREENVAEHVSEHCYRIPYFEALYYIHAADALIILGSDNPSYSASKIFPYLLAQKPLITIAHLDSLMLKIVQRQELAFGYGFTPEEKRDDERKIVIKIYTEWFLNKGYQTHHAKENELPKPYSAAEMTSHLANVFDLVITGA